MSELATQLSQLDIEPIEVVSTPRKKELTLEELIGDGIETNEAGGTDLGLFATYYGSCSTCASGCQCACIGLCCMAG